MDNKSRLLAESARLFAEKGVDAVGVREIVAACEVTKPTLYHYYGSKEGLLRALLDHGFQDLSAALDTQGAYEYDLPGYLERMAGIWMDCVRRQPDFFRIEIQLVFMPSAHFGHQLVLSGHEALQTRMETLFSAAVKEYGNMRGRQRVLATGWLGALNMWATIYLGGWGDPEGDFMKAGLRQFLYGVFS